MTLLLRKCSTKTLGAALLVLVATSSVMLIIVIIVIIVFCRRRLQVGSDVVTSVDESNCSDQHEDVERLLPTNDLLRHRAGSVDDDDDDDELHRGRGVGPSSRLDFNATRLSLNSRRCLVETEEVDSEGMPFFTIFTAV